MHGIKDDILESIEFVYAGFDDQYEDLVFDYDYEHREVVFLKQLL